MGKKQQTKQSRAFAMAAALEALKPLRVTRDPNTDGRWAYFAEETDSWWSVSSDSIVALGEMDPIDVETWATDDKEGYEIGRHLR